MLQQFPELAPYVDLTAESFGDLEQGLTDLIKASPDDLIETLQEFKVTKGLTAEQAAQIDNLCEALGNMPTDAIKDVTGEFGVLAEQIKAATVVQTELENKLAEDDYDAGYEGRVEAYGGFQEVLDAGEYGSKAYSAYKEYFGLMEKTPEQIKSWMVELNKMHRTKPVVCVESGEFFLGVRDAMKKTGVWHTSVRFACTGVYQTAGGFHWRYATPKEISDYENANGINIRIRS